MADFQICISVPLNFPFEFALPLILEDCNPQHNSIKIMEMMYREVCFLSFLYSFFLKNPGFFKKQACFGKPWDLPASPRSPWLWVYLYMNALQLHSNNFWFLSLSIICRNKNLFKNVAWTFEKNRRFSRKNWKKLKFTNWNYSTSRMKMLKRNWMISCKTKHDCYCKIIFSWLQSQDHLNQEYRKM